jgi:hypothetical protein
VDCAMAVAKNKKNQIRLAINLPGEASDEQTCGFEVQALAFPKSMRHGDNIPLLNTTMDPYFSVIADAIKHRAGNESLIQGLAARNQAFKASGVSCPFEVAYKNRDQEQLAGLKTAAGSTLSTGKRTVSVAADGVDGCISAEGAGSTKRTKGLEGGTAASPAEKKKADDRDPRWKRSVSFAANVVDGCVSAEGAGSTKHSNGRNEGGTDATPTTDDRDPRDAAGSSGVIAGSTDGAQNSDLRTGTWTEAGEWSMRAFLHSAPVAQRRSALYARSLYESWSKKVDNGELVDRTEEKAAAEAEVTLLEFDDILLEALGCLYNPLKIEVIKAVDKKIQALQNQAGVTASDPDCIHKLLNDAWQAPTSSSVDATAVDRVLVSTGNGFRDVRGPDRRELVERLAKEVLLNPRRPSAREVRAARGLRPFTRRFPTRSMRDCFDFWPLSPSPTFPCPCLSSMNENRCVAGCLYTSLADMRDMVTSWMSAMPLRLMHWRLHPSSKLKSCWKSKLVWVRHVMRPRREACRVPREQC